MIWLIGEESSPTVNVIGPTLSPRATVWSTTGVTVGGWFGTGGVMSSRWTTSWLPVVPTSVIARASGLRARLTYPAGVRMIDCSMSPSPPNVGSGSPPGVRAMIGSVA